MRRRGAEPRVQPPAREERPALPSEVIADVKAAVIAGDEDAYRRNLLELVALAELGQMPTRLAGVASTSLEPTEDRSPDCPEVTVQSARTPAQLIVPMQIEDPATAMEPFLVFGLRARTGTP